jgi:hypothetical protein
MAYSRIDVAPRSSLGGDGLLGVVAVGDGGAAAGSDIPTVGTADTSSPWDFPLALLAIGIVVGAAFWADSMFGDGSYPPAIPPVPPDGLTIFAGLYVAAQAIERLIEPLSKVVLRKEPAEGEAAGAKDAARNAVSTMLQADASPTNEAIAAVQALLDVAAKADAAVKRIYRFRVVVFWLLASVVGVFASAVMKLYLLNRVGIANPSRVSEVLATGLILGAGTKPLHDLIELISAKKSTSEDNAKAAKGKTEGEV